MNPRSASQFVFCGSSGSARSLIRQRSACLKESLWEGSSGRPGYILGGATRHLLRGDIAKNCVEKRAAWFFLHPPCPGCRSASVWKQETTETKCIQVCRDVFCLWSPQSSSRIGVPASGGGCWLAGRSVKSSGRLRPAAFLVTMNSMRPWRFWWYLQWKEKRLVSADSY